MSKLADAMEAQSSSRIAGRKPAPTRKLKKEKSASAASTPQEVTSQAAAKAANQPRVNDSGVRSHLEKGIAELQGLHDLLLTSEVDPDVLSDFRDALNRVRNTAWAAQQYVVRKETDQDSTSVLSLLAGERIRTAYQLCEALSEDLKRIDIEFQRGSLVQLRQITKTLTEQLKNIIDKL
jgi:predicted metal-dependent hydrolase